MNAQPWVIDFSPIEVFRPEGTLAIQPKVEQVFAKRMNAQPWVIDSPRGNPKGVASRKPAMPQSLAKVHLHVVFSTKDRLPCLKSREIRARLYAYMATLLRERVDSPATLINGVEDHVHVLCRLSRSFAIQRVVQVVKTESAKWIKREVPNLSSFQWQGGYAVFSVSESRVGDVRAYIAGQEAHHQKKSFQDELRALLKKHKMEFDEDYLWS